MSRVRSSATDLGKLLDAAAGIVYVLDARRRIVFLNAAARAWIGESADDLLGQECRYHSEPNEKGLVPYTGLLCPPPEAFLGRRTSAVVTLPGTDEQPQTRNFDFIPLTAADEESGGVLALEVAAAPDARLDPQATPSSAELHARLAQQRAFQRERYQLDRLIGATPAMVRVRAQVRVATDAKASVLVVGPPKSGRQHVARAIHYGRPLDALGPLVPLACGLLGAELLQASIRGLARTKTTERLATLLLTDVDEMPAEAQAELAGFLRLTDLPVRIISTARQPLVDLASAGRFPAELACLLSTLVIELPPLVSRLDDLPLLAQHFLEQANARGTKQLSGISPDALDALAGYAWTGEIEELAAMIREAHAAAEGLELLDRDLPPRIGLAADATRYARRADDSIALEQFLAEIERELIERALAKAKGNKTKAARLLGMTRPRLYRRLVQLGMESEVLLEGDQGE